MTQTQALPTGTAGIGPQRRRLGTAVVAVLALLITIAVAVLTLALVNDDAGAPVPPVVRESPTWNTPECPLRGIC
jgi:hypothetical protein